MSETKKRKTSSSELPPTKDKKGSVKEKEIPSPTVETENEDFSFESLTPIVKKRVAALEKLQEQIKVIHAEFLAEESKLLIKYEQSKEPLFKKRSEIISGAYEPKKADLPLDFKESEEKKKKKKRRKRKKKSKEFPNFGFKFSSVKQLILSMKRIEQLSNT